MSRSPVLVQWITTYWTKASRGAPLAARRASVPMARLLPSAFAETGGEPLRLQVLGYDEKNGFEAPKWERVEARAFEGPFPISDLTLSSETPAGARTECLEIEYRWRSGMPERQYCDARGSLRPVVRRLSLTSGKWARVRYNGRFSDYDTGDWWYELHTFNIGFGIPSIDSRVFLDSQPSEELELIDTLR